MSDQEDYDEDEQMDIDSSQVDDIDDSNSEDSDNDSDSDAEDQLYHEYVQVLGVISTQAYVYDNYVQLIEIAQ